MSEADEFAVLNEPAALIIKGLVAMKGYEESFIKNASPLAKKYGVDRITWMLAKKVIDSADCPEYIKEWGLEKLYAGMLGGALHVLSMEEGT